MTELAPWLAALHLASPALPVGAYSYSAGLEAAHAAGLVGDEHSAFSWIEAGLDSLLERAEAPAWVLHYRAWHTADWEQVRTWNTWFLCARDSLELRAETEQMGWSMVRLIEALELGSPAARRVLLDLGAVSYPAASAFAYSAQSVSEALGLAAYCFAYLEGQVSAALKIVPLGQLSGQRLLIGLTPKIAGLVDRARRRADDAPLGIETFAPQLAILSARHESQYSRLFRS